MCSGNSTKYLNGSLINDEKCFGEIVFSRTLLLTPLVVLLVILFSSLAYYVVKKRALNKRQHHLVPVYHFDPGECDNCEDDILEAPIKHNSKMGHQSYNSMRVLQK